jgi:hypothetical protein
LVDHHRGLQRIAGRYGKVEASLAAKTDGDIAKLDLVTLAQRGRPGHQLPRDVGAVAALLVCDHITRGTDRDDRVLAGKRLPVQDEIAARLAADRTALPEVKRLAVGQFEPSLAGGIRGENHGKGRLSSEPSIAWVRN